MCIQIFPNVWLLTFSYLSTSLDNYYTALESGFSLFYLLCILPTLSSALPLSLSHAQLLLHLLIALYHFRMGVRLLVLNHFSFGEISYIARRHVNMGHTCEVHEDGHTRGAEYIS